MVPTGPILTTAALSFRKHLSPLCLDFKELQISPIYSLLLAFILFPSKWTGSKKKKQTMATFVSCYSLLTGIGKGRFLSRKEAKAKPMKSCKIRIVTKRTMNPGPQIAEIRLLLRLGLNLILWFVSWYPDCFCLTQTQLNFNGYFTMINKCQFSVLSPHYSIFTDFIYAKSIFIGLNVWVNCSTVDNNFMVYVFCKVPF